MPRKLEHPAPDEVQLERVLHALSDPIRLSLVRDFARCGSATACRDMPAPEVTRSTLSHHLRVLREAGLTWTELSGTQRFVSLRGEVIEQRFPGLLAAVGVQTADQPTAASK